MDDRRILIKSVAECQDINPVPHNNGNIIYIMKSMPFYANSNLTLLNDTFQSLFIYILLSNKRRVLQVEFIIHIQPQRLLLTITSIL